MSVTYTLNDWFGAKVTAADTGVLLNDEMDDFTVKAGVPNIYGLVQGEANAIAPGKRPLSSMSPTIVTKDGKPVMVLGTPGGSRIITTVLLTILNVIDYGMDMQEAVDAPRFHQQWLPEGTTVEEFALSRTRAGSWTTWATSSPRPARSHAIGHHRRRAVARRRGARRQPLLSAPTIRGATRGWRWAIEDPLGETAARPRQRARSPFFAKPPRNPEGDAPSSRSRRRPEPDPARSSQRGAGRAWAGAAAPRNAGLANPVRGATRDSRRRGSNPGISSAGMAAPVKRSIWRTAPRSA